MTSATDADARSSEHHRPVLPQNGIAWLVAAAALTVAFAAGTLTGSRAAVHDSAPAEALPSEGQVLFSDLEPPNLQRAIDAEAEQ